GSDNETTERLMTIQYGDKVVDMAKANYIKAVLESLADKYVNGHKVDVVTESEEERLEVFTVVAMGFLDEFESPETPVKVSILQEVTDVEDSVQRYDTNQDKYVGGI